VTASGVHVANIEACACGGGLSFAPGYLLSDGFRVPGCRALSFRSSEADAASVGMHRRGQRAAKGSRDAAEGGDWSPTIRGWLRVPNKGYRTRRHSAALKRAGTLPPEHRIHFINVRRVASGSGYPDSGGVRTGSSET